MISSNRAFSISKVNRLHYLFYNSKLLLVFITTLILGACKDSQIQEYAQTTYLSSTKEIKKLDSLIQQFDIVNAELLLQEEWYVSQLQQGNIEVIYLQSKFNNFLKFSTPNKYKKQLVPTIDSLEIRDRIPISIAQLYNFQYNTIEQLMTDLNKADTLTTDEIIFQNGFYLVGDYYQTEDFDLDKSISYFTKSIETSEKHGLLNYIYLDALYKLILLEHINRDLVKAMFYVQKYSMIQEKHFPKNKILETRKYYIRSFIQSRMGDFESAKIDMLKALNHLPPKDCYCDRQEAYKVIASEFSNHNEHYIIDSLTQIMEKEIKQCGDFCNMEKILGAIAHNKGDFKQSKENFEKAFQYIASHQPYNNKQLGAVIYYLNDVYLKTHNYQDALNATYTQDHNSRPKKILTFDLNKIYSKKVKNTLYYFMSLTDYSTVFYKKYIKFDNFEDLENAYSIINNAKKLVQNELFSVDEDVVLNVFSYSEPLYQKGMEITYEMYKKTKNEKYLKELYIWSEHNKARIFQLDILDSKQNGNYTKIKILRKKIETAKREQNYGDSLSAWKQEIELISNNNNLANQLTEYIERLDNLILNKQDSSVVLDFTFGEEYLYVIEISNKKLSARKIAWKKNEKSLLSKVIQYTQNPKTYLHSDTLEKLYTVLFDNHTEYPKDIIVVASGDLFQLSFDVLTHNNRALIETHNITYSNSISQALKPKSDRKYNHTSRVQGYFFTDDYTLVNSDYQLPELNGNIAEKNILNSYFNNPRIFTGKENTVKNFYTTTSSSPLDILHIGTHAMASSSDRSDLRIYFRDDLGIGIDSMYASDLLGLEMDASLVILSACETSSGQYKSGEGEYNIKRYFQVSGGDQIISSLWSLDDGAAKRIFNDFYSYLPTSNPQEALRSAKIKLMKANQYSHPYFWGGLGVSR